MKRQLQQRVSTVQGFILGVLEEDDTNAKARGSDKILSGLETNNLISRITLDKPVPMVGFRQLGNGSELDVNNGDLTDLSD